MKAWKIYRLDNDVDVYFVFAADREAAINTARLEHFGLVLLRSQLGAGLFR